MKNMEFIPKGVLNNGFGLVCQSFGSPICASFAKKIIFGQSKSETNYVSDLSIKFYNVFL